MQPNNSMSSNAEHLTVKMREKAEKELGETTLVKKEALIALRKLVKEEKNLVCREDDAHLLTYLRAKKFRVEDAFKLLQSYYTFKKNNDDVFKPPDFAGLMTSVKDVMLYALPMKDVDGCTVLLMDLSKWDLNQRSVARCLHDLIIGCMFCIEDPVGQICGIKIIFDASCLSLYHVQRIHPKYLRLIAEGLKSALPIRVKEIHIIASAVFPCIWKVVQLFVIPKLRSRVHFHEVNSSTLLNYMDENVVPVQYGGKHAIDQKRNLEIALQMKSVYEEKMKMGYK